MIEPSQASNGDALQPWHLAIAVATFLVGTMTTLFVGGRWVGKIEQLGKTVHDAMTEWKDDRKKLETIALHELRIAQLEKLLATMTSRLDAVWRKVFSHDRRIAVIAERSGSGVDVNEAADTDPPPRDRDEDGG